MSRSLRSYLRRFALLLLLALVGTSLLADKAAPAGYEEQFREFPSAKPCWKFPLGTDELGRDRLSRLLYGSRVSLLLAPAAAALATGIALALGLLAGYCGGIVERAALACTDLFVAMPSLLLMFIARAMLPLNISPAVSVSFTFALLGLLGWTSGVRVILAAVAKTQRSEFILQARASGCPPAKIALLHMTAAVRPIVVSQFWILVPLFLVAEANLGMLGLGVTEPLPSWGNLLAELQSAPSLWDAPWLLAPAALLVSVLLSLRAVARKESLS
jgi:ABC-type dipeptide/oligopeptide/nickel transport system permease subunit